MRHFVSLLLLLAISTAAQAHILWRGNFETGDISQWAGAQEVSPDRLQVVTNPVHQGHFALRATVRQGDNPIQASGNRNELFMDTLEPEGSEYYYRWSTMFDPSYPSEEAWQVFTQWHQNTCCGSPPVEFDILGEEIQLHNNDTLTWSAPLVRGVWHDFVFHVKWSSNPNIGFEELWYDGRHVIPKRSVATGADTYLKQGLYRNASIVPVGIVYHDGFVKGETYDDVVPPPPPAPIVDAGVVVPDAGTPETHPDAGSLEADAGAPDADGGIAPADDGGTIGIESDAGSEPGPASFSGLSATAPPASPVAKGGCSSTGAMGALSGQGLVFLLVAWTSRRRRNRRPFR